MSEQFKFNTPLVATVNELLLSIVPWLPIPFQSAGGAVRGIDIQALNRESQCLLPSTVLSYRFRIDTPGADLQKRLPFPVTKVIHCPTMKLRWKTFEQNTLIRFGISALGRAMAIGIICLLGWLNAFAQSNSPVPARIVTRYALTSMLEPCGRYHRRNTRHHRIERS